MREAIHNFYPGPSALPTPVLEQARDEMLDYHGTGVSILETSHRSKAYDRIHEQARSDLKHLLGLGDEHEVVLMGGGARTQFAAVPLNLGEPDRPADYVVAGRWGQLALEEARHHIDARELWSSAETGHDRVPGPGELAIEPDRAYVHVTTNNTIVGTQLSDFPDTGDVPLVGDLSSDIGARSLAYARFDLAYAGAQKNLGPAGVTIVLVRRELLERAPSGIPEMLTYARLAEKRSLLNTPPVYAIYLLGLVVRHALDVGGITARDAQNRDKARKLYDVIDRSEGFYRGHAQTDSRSLQNVTFRLPSEDLEARFLEEAEEAGMLGLKGHRSIGGIRASLYNWVPSESVEALAAFMEAFQERHG